MTDLLKSNEKYCDIATTQSHWLISGQNSANLPETLNKHRDNTEIRT